MPIVHCSPETGDRITWDNESGDEAAILALHPDSEAHRLRGYAGYTLKGV